MPSNEEQGYIFPASAAQKRLWFQNELEPGNPAYNLTAAWRLAGPLDGEALGRSLNELVRRHETLRTRFAAAEGKPYQIIAPELEIDLERLDLTALPEAERDAAVERRIAQESETPFDPERAPLLRTTLIRLADNLHVLILVIHHVITDDWSIGIFIRELGTIYDAFRRGSPSPLAELPIQYADFAEWQESFLAGEARAAQLAYWREQLGGDLPVLELPTSRPRPAVFSYRGARHSFPLPAELATALKQLSSAEGATLFMTLLGAYAVLLSRYLEADDLPIGVPIAGRNQPDTEPLIGFFINSLVLRARLEGRPSFRELLRRVRRITLDAYAHQDLPFEEVVEELRPVRTPNRHPLCQMVFALQNLPPTHLELGELRIRPLEIEAGHALLDLALEMQETADGGLRGWFVYCTDLLDRGTVEHMADAFATLLGALAADPDRPVHELPLVGEAARRMLLEEWNATAAELDPALTIPGLLERQAARAGERTALAFPDQASPIFAGDELSYAELDRRANQLAHHLRARGVARETLVGIFLERSPEMVLALVAVLKAGGAYVPLDPGYPRAQLEQMLDDARCPLVVTSDALASRLPATGAGILCLDAAWEAVAEESDTAPEAGSAPGDLAYVLYTSGTTGRPKGVLVEHRAVVNRLVHQDGYRLSPSDRVLQIAALGFDVAAWEILGPLASGAAVVLARPQGEKDSGYLADLIARAGITHCVFVPSMLRVMLEEEAWGRATALRAVFCGAEALPAELARELLERFEVELINFYGPTEATIDATFHPCRRDDLPSAGTVSIGRPITNTELFVVDAEGQLVSVGAPGELWIGGLGLARGYLNDPELTARKFVRHPFRDDPDARLYRTGDRVRYLASGELEFLGRVDHQVKIRGMRVELGEIEAILREHPAVRDAVVAMHGDEAGDQRLAAYAVPEKPVELWPDVVGYFVYDELLYNSMTYQKRYRENAFTRLLFADEGIRMVPAERPEAELSARSLGAYLREQLPEHMVPDALLTLDAVPRLASGKTDYSALPRPDWAASDPERAYAPPRTREEEELAAIWSELFGVERIGIHDSFFALGGHSLLATQLLSRVRKQYHTDLPLRAFFENPTIAGLSVAILEHLIADQDASQIETVLAEIEALEAAESENVFRPSVASEHLWVLGINSAYHESSACLLRDGEIVAVVEEERFTRKKHGKIAAVHNPDELPVRAIDYCLATALIRLEDVPWVGFSMNPPGRLRNKYFPEDVVPEDWGGAIGEEEYYRNLCRIPDKLHAMGFRGDFQWIGHHVCHAASAYYVSPFDEAAILSVDGIGETGSTLFAHGRDRTMQELGEIHYPASLGFLWEKFSKYLGFTEYDACKLMGLSAYGKPDRYLDEFAEILQLAPSGLFVIDNDIFRFRQQDYKPIERLFGCPKRNPGDPIHKTHHDIAATLQTITDRTMLHMVRHLRETTGSANLCMAGGVALNCVSNSYLFAESAFDQLYIQPAAHDAGTALGAALYIWNMILEKERRQRMIHPYWGPSFTNDEIEAALRARDLVYERLDDGHLEARTAELLSRGKIVGWFQGATEFGPRALGNRSLLADPRDLNMKDLLNARVKHRESFRPFAPSVLAEQATEWFEIPKPTPASDYMLMAYPVKAAKRDRIPAAIHVDGTSRIQTVTRETNPRYHRLLSKFFELTGVPLVVNTSFNDNEPIVNTPADAVNTYCKTLIDYLVIGDFLVDRERQENLEA